MTLIKLPFYNENNLVVVIFYSSIIVLNFYFQKDYLEDNFNRKGRRVQELTNLLSPLSRTTLQSSPPPSAQPHRKGSCTNREERTIK